MLILMFQGLLFDLYFKITLTTVSRMACMWWDSGKTNQEVVSVIQARTKVAPEGMEAVVL